MALMGFSALPRKLRAGVAPAFYSSKRVYVGGKVPRETPSNFEKPFLKGETF